MMQLLQIALPFIAQMLRAFGVREEKIKEFIAWVHLQQKEASQSTLPSEKEAKAKQSLLERIRKRKQNADPS